MLWIYIGLDIEISERVGGTPPIWASIERIPLAIPLRPRHGNLYVHVMVTFTSTSCSMGTGSVMTIRLTITVIIVGLRERKGYYGASSTTLDIEIRLSLDRSWLVERPVGILIA